jgi:hypothetical protein
MHMHNTFKEKQMQGKYRNIEWLELEGGILTECAIMKRSSDGHVWFFPIKPLDMVDKQRLLKILRNRNAELYELWDLMSQITLGNGVNALTYFNQLVKVRTPSGQVLPFGSGQYGTPVQAQGPYSNQTTFANNQSEPMAPMTDSSQLQAAVETAKAPARGRTR